jgi:hypothetical protein
MELSSRYVQCLLHQYMRLTLQYCMQIIFMELLGGIFKVTSQNWKEWLAAIAIGAGSMVVAFLTKAVTRCAKDRCLQGLSTCCGTVSAAVSSMLCICILKVHVKTTLSGTLCTHYFFRCIKGRPLDSTSNGAVQAL